MNDDVGIPCLIDGDAWTRVYPHRDQCVCVELRAGGRIALIYLGRWGHAGVILYRVYAGEASAECLYHTYIPERTTGADAPEPQF